MIVETVADVRQAVGRARQADRRVGLVPTMGALHAGHASLIEAARRECDCVCVSIFVNPKQFGPQEDFARYPRTWDQDLELCRRSGAELIFHPGPDTVYPAEFRTYVDVQGLSDVLEGKFRPGHFRGVCTVVLKLLLMVGPDIAYFGQKDFQQQLLVRRMCADLNMPVEIRVCPTIREPDGLALSSRNIYLDAGARRQALTLHATLTRAQERVLSGERDLSRVRAEMWKMLADQSGVRPDYATVADAATLQELETPSREMVALVAARVGDTRLIDNVLLSADERPPNARGPEEIA